MATNSRVLGVIRPSAEIIGNYTKTREIGILGTNGTVESQSYPIEIEKFFPDIQVYQHACPLWVPLMENNEYDFARCRLFHKKRCDALVKQFTGNRCHFTCLYPLSFTFCTKLKNTFRKGYKLVSQGEIIASSLENYLHRHPEIDEKCSKNGQIQFFTTDSVKDFDKHSAVFFGKKYNSIHIDL